MEHVIFETSLQFARIAQHYIVDSDRQFTTEFDRCRVMVLQALPDTGADGARLGCRTRPTAPAAQYRRASNCGELTAPPHRMTSRAARAVQNRPSWRNAPPTARCPTAVGYLRPAMQRANLNVVTAWRVPVRCRFTSLGEATRERDPLFLAVFGSATTSFPRSTPGRRNKASRLMPNPSHV
jgi:hypothetical protein